MSLYVDLPPNAEIDRLGFYCEPRGRTLFVRELATTPGQVAREMVEAARRERKRRPAYLEAVTKR